MNFEMFKISLNPGYFNVQLLNSLQETIKAGC